MLLRQIQLATGVLLLKLLLQLARPTIHAHNLETIIGERAVHARPHLAQIMTLIRVDTLEQSSRIRSRPTLLHRLITAAAIQAGIKHEAATIRVFDGQRVIKVGHSWDMRGSGRLLL